jgi:hypothetical protein
MRKHPNEQQFYIMTVLIGSLTDAELTHAYPVRLSGQKEQERYRIIEFCNG